MTDAAALAEAMRRWGIVGGIQESRGDIGVRCYVGKYVLSRNGVVGGFNPIGRGNSWEEAFSDADRNAKE